MKTACIHMSQQCTLLKSAITLIYYFWALQSNSYQIGTLALMGKHLGLEEKSNNSLMSTFILERQLKDLQTSLGVIYYFWALQSNSYQIGQELPSLMCRIKLLYHSYYIWFLFFWHRYYWWIKIKIGAYWNSCTNSSTATTSTSNNITAPLTCQRKK